MSAGLGDGCKEPCIREGISAKRGQLSRSELFGDVVQV
jgi:hypothetical protein